MEGTEKMDSERNEGMGVRYFIREKNEEKGGQGGGPMGEKVKR